MNMQADQDDDDNAPLTTKWRKQMKNKRVIDSRQCRAEVTKTIMSTFLIDKLSIAYLLHPASEL